MLPVELIPLGIILFFVAIIGIIGNSIMIIAFLKHAKLRSPCHYFIAITCLADSLHNYGQIIFTAHLFFDIQTSHFVCTLLNIPTLIGVISGSCWILAMGIDRFFACKWPASYRSLVSYSLYTFLQLVFPFIYTSIFLLFAFLEVDYTPMTCAIPLAMGSKTFVTWSFSNMALNAFTMMLYTSVYFLVRKKETGQKFKAVFKSIFITATLVIIGWTVTCISNTFVVLFVLYGKQIVNMYAGIPVNIACASNIFVFYRINLDYRSGIRKIFPCKTTTVGSIHVHIERNASITTPGHSPNTN